MQEIGELLVLQLNQWVSNSYCASFSGNGSEIYSEQPEKTIDEFCNIIEQLSDNSLRLWRNCSKRLADLAFESGTEPKQISYRLPTALISRLEKLKIAIVTTIYQIGAYAIDDKKPLL